MITYKFKTEEKEIDSKTRTIVKSEPVPATTQETEFTLEQKERELESAKEAEKEAIKRTKDLEAEILVIKDALAIK